MRIDNSFELENILLVGAPTKFILSCLTNVMHLDSLLWTSQICPGTYRINKVMEYSFHNWLDMQDVVCLWPTSFIALKHLFADLRAKVFNLFVCVVCSRSLQQPIMSLCSNTINQLMTFAIIVVEHKMFSKVCFITCYELKSLESLSNPLASTFI